MAIKTSVFIAASLDGFISRLDGSIDWLDKANALIPDGEDFGYRVFMDKIDALVMGRITFEQVLTFDKWPYGDKKVIVLSRKGIEVPRALDQKVTVTAETPELLLERLASERVRQVYVDGGQTIQSFLRAGLIDEITLTVIPILLGKGKPLFGSLRSDIMLKHVFTKTYPCGYVQSKYLLEKGRFD